MLTISYWIFGTVVRTYDQRRHIVYTVIDIALLLLMAWAIYGN